MAGLITNWSFSKLMTYEHCAFRVKLKYIDKAPEPPVDDKSPLLRGQREHDLFEKYVTGERPSLDGSTAKRLADFEKPFDDLRALYASLGSEFVHIEQDWLFDADWMSMEGRDWALMMKLDFGVHDAEQRRYIVGDYKTGGSTYKAAEHVQQTQLYAAAAALRNPEVDHIVTELWYVDEGEIRRYEYTADQALAYIPRFQQRADRMLNDRYFRPNPNRITCKWCPYNSRGTGICPVSAV